NSLLCPICPSSGKFEKHAAKGRLVYVAGKLQTRRWKKDGEESDRFSTEILLVPGSVIQFLDKPNGAPASAAQKPAEQPATTPGNGSEIPF
ncbi:MAG: single-stranded DNA-binding protein, partial [Acidobacteriota bacterium]|nr:single-stranded DNA-binding protein [Acidobacteriota bacterium]